MIILDVRGRSPTTDYVVIGTGTSDRQMKSVLDDVRELSTELGHGSSRIDSDDRSLWLLADFADVVVHLFEPNTRAHYDLEMIWGDAPRVDFARDGEPPTTGIDRAGINR